MDRSSSPGDRSASPGDRSSALGDMSPAPLDRGSSRGQELSSSRGRELSSGRYRHKEPGEELEEAERPLRPHPGTTALIKPRPPPLFIKTLLTVAFYINSLMLFIKTGLTAGFY